MSKLKNKKSILKRIKISTNNKVMHDVPGLSHLLAKKTSRTRMRKLKSRKLSKYSAKLLFLGLKSYKS